MQKVPALYFNFKNRTSLLSILLFGTLLFSVNLTSAQEEDSSKYNSHKENFILYTDYGYRSAPFSIKYSFPSGIDKIKYRHNFKMMLGVGMSYKWFSLRFAAALNNNVRPISDYGKSNYYDFGVNFSIGKTYTELDFRFYEGYVLKDAYRWDDSLNQIHPNDISQKINTSNLGLRFWYFDNKQFRMDPLYGIKGDYKENVTTWYLTGRFDIYSVYNTVGSLLPTALYDSTNTKTASTALTGADIGVIPGLGHVQTMGNWQVGALLAIGPIVQFKTYALPNNNTTKAAIVARYDVKLIAGYSKKRYFVMYRFDLDNKNISFDALKYKQTYYGMRLTVGYRLGGKRK